MRTLWIGINEILPMLDEMVTEGLVTLEAVEIIASRSSTQPRPLRSV